jgi:FkbM family methyltransferase
MYGRFRIIDYLVYRYVMRNPKLRGLLQKIIYPSGIRSVCLLGQTFKIDCQSEIGYYRASVANNTNIFFRDEVPQFLSFVAAISPGMTVVDVGANVGTWTVQLASLGSIVDGLNIIAFEPHPKTFQRLKDNCACFSNVTLHNIALSDHKGMLEFFETTTSGVFGVTKSHFNEADENKRTLIQAVTLDEYLDGTENVALKIDVEGHELEVLRGAANAISNGAVRIVFTDGVADETYQEFRRILIDNGFTIYNARSRKPELASDLYHTILALKQKASHYC